jgi:hypothetical protein
MHQLTLDDAALFAMKNSRRGDHLNSIRAAQNAYRHAARTRDLALLAHYAHPDGLTDFELAALTNVSQPSIGKRRLDLQREDFITDTGMSRAAPSGSSATVWRITEKGKRAALELKQASNA